MLIGCVIEQTDTTIEFVPDGCIRPAQINKSLCEYILRQGGIPPTKARIQIPLWKIKQLEWEAYDDRLAVKDNIHEQDPEEQ